MLIILRIFVLQTTTTMVHAISQEEWSVLGDIVGATKNLQARLEEKGYSVINNFETGLNRAQIVFIVEVNGSKLFSCVVFDALNEQERLKAELFSKGEELLSVDRVAMEKKMLIQRLSELDGHGGLPACQG